MTSSTVLVAAEAFGGELDAARATRAIGRGLRTSDLGLAADLCPIGALSADLPRDLDARMHGAHAVLIATARLNHETLLQRDAVFEIATRARQTGVPCYAIAGSDELDLFEARILDLQVVLEADSERLLTSVAKKLTSLM